jgi:hypothetical protein
VIGAATATHVPQAHHRLPACLCAPQRDMARVLRKLFNLQRKLGRSFKPLKMPPQKDLQYDYYDLYLEDKGFVKTGPYVPKPQKNDTLRNTLKGGLVDAKQLDLALGSKDPLVVQDVLQAVDQRVGSSGGAAAGGLGLRAAAADGSSGNATGLAEPLVRASQGPAGDATASPSSSAATESAGSPETTSAPNAEEAVLRLATEDQQPEAPPQLGQPPGAAEARALAGLSLPDSALGSEDLVDPQTAVADTLLRAFDSAVSNFQASSSLAAQLLAQPSVKELQGDISGRLAQVEALLQQQVADKEANVTARKEQVRPAGCTRAVRPCHGCSGCNRSAIATSLLITSPFSRRRTCGITL